MGFIILELNGIDVGGFFNGMKEIDARPDILRVCPSRGSLLL